MTDDLARRVAGLARRLVGIAVRTEPHYRIAYGFDATGRRGRCAGVAFPATLDEARRVILAAGEAEVPLFVRGAGTGFSGGSVPAGGGLVLSTERLRRILAVDRDRLEAEVECGVVNRELQDRLESGGLFYPPDPASLKVSTIGGNIAENAGGPRAYRYGVTRRYVRAITWITAAGETVTTPAEGPAALLVGGEGTLGFVYAARLALLALPEDRRTSLLAVGGDAAAMRTAAELLGTGFTPTVLEFIDAKTMRTVGEYRRIGGAGEGIARLFLEIDGPRREVAGQQRLLESFCRDRGLDLVTARNEGEREALWELRRSISPSLARRGVTKVNEDVSLPLGRLEEAVRHIHELAGRLQLDCYIFGHCGDGNLHVNIMTDRRRREEMERVERFVDELFRRVVGLGGTLSGEHGIGMTKAPWLPVLFPPEAVALQRGIARAMDPGGLFNPGKYFEAGAA
ncbi:MAG: FAD-binding protein [Candidatus Krumholzibacteriota bacterium]|nr:FAD-binding protein [Candidatus Krumholzibacteriota bacterium]